MINEKVFLQIPLDFEKGVKIYPPTVKEVFENKYFPMYRQLLLSSQEDIEDTLVKEKPDLKQFPTPLDFLFGVIQDKKMEFLVRKGFDFFIKDKITFLPKQKMIIIGDLQNKLSTIKNIEELPILNEENFLKFQNLLRLSIGEKKVEPPDPNEHPRIKKMKAKARERDRVKAKQNGTSFGVTLTSICCMGIGITPLNIGEMSYASVSAIIERYQAKEKYELDIQSMLAGAKGVQPKYWIRDLDKD